MSTSTSTSTVLASSDFTKPALPSSASESQKLADADIPTDEYERGCGVCFEAEKVAIGAKDLRNTIYSRILGCMFLFFRKQAPPETIINDIESYNRKFNDSEPYTAVYSFGKMYYHGLIQNFERKGPTYTIREHPSDSSFNEERKEIMECMRLSSETSAVSQSTIRQTALSREDYHCHVSEKLDSSAVFWELVQRQPPNAPLGDIECCHIFPQRLGNFTPGRYENLQREEQVATMWTILSRFGYKRLFEELNGNLNRAENVFLLAGHLHKSFDRNIIWFTPVEGEDNTYTIDSAIDSFATGTLPSDRFTFKTETGTSLPDRDYLSIRAGCCRVAFESGALKHVELLLHDRNEAIEEMQSNDDEGMEEPLVEEGQADDSDEGMGEPAVEEMQSNNDEAMEEPDSVEEGQVDDGGEGMGEPSTMDDDPEEPPAGVALLATGLLTVALLGLFIHNFLRFVRDLLGRWAAHGRRLVHL